MDLSPALTVFNNRYFGGILPLNVDRKQWDDIVKYTTIIEQKARDKGVFDVPPTGALQGRNPGKLDKQLRRLRTILNKTIAEHFPTDSLKSGDGPNTRIDNRIHCFRCALNYYLKGEEAKVTKKEVLYEECYLQDFYLLMMLNFGIFFGLNQQVEDNQKCYDEIFPIISEIDELLNKILSNKIKKSKSRLEQLLAEDRAQKIAFDLEQNLLPTDIQEAFKITATILQSRPRPSMPPSQ